MIKASLKLLRSAFTGLVLFVVLSFVLFQIEPVRQTLSKAVLDTVEYKTGWKIEVERCESALPLRLSINGLNISQYGKPFLSIDRLRANIAPAGILHGSLIFSFLELDGLTTFNQASQPPDAGSSLILPFRKIAVRKLFLKHINLHGCPEEARHLDITGSVNFFTLRGYVSAKLGIKHEHLSTSALPLSFSLKKRKQGFDWIAGIDETAEGLIHELCNIKIPVPLKLTASGNSEAALGEFQLQTDLSRINKTPADGIGNHILLKGICAIAEDGAVKISELTGHSLDTPLSFSGGITYEPEKEFIDGKINLSPFTISDYGEVAASLTVRGSKDSPAATLNCFSPEITIGGHSIAQFHSQAVFSLHENLWNGEWIAKGNYENLPLTLTCSTTFNQDKHVEISKLAATCPSGSLHGSLNFDPENRQLTGQLDGSLQSLERIGKGVRMPLEGSLGLHVKLKQDVLKISAQGNDIAFNSIKSEKFSLEGNIKHIWDDYQAEFSINAYQLFWKDTKWEEFSFGTAVTKCKNTWPFSLTARGDKESGSELNASGKWHLENKDFFVHLGVASGHVFDVPYSLNSPANIYALHDEIRTSVITFSLGEGEIRIEAKVLPDDINCLIDMKDLPTSLCNHLLPDPLGMNGKVSCFLRLAGPPEDIQGSIALKGKDLQLYDEFFAKLPICEAKAEAVLSDNVLTFEGELYDSPNPVFCSGKLPIALSLYPFKVELPSRQRMHTQLKASGEIAPYLELFVTDTTNVQGLLDLEVVIGGTPDHPIVEGSASIKDGTYESLNTGAVLNNIEMSLIGNDKKLILENFTGFDGLGGKVTAAGNILLGTGTPFALDVEIDKATLMRLDYASMTMSGNVKFTGDSSRGKIEGDLLVDNALLEIPEQVPIQMKTVDVTYINDQVKENPFTKEKKKQPWPIELDLNFDVPSSAFVTGKNLKSEWKGGFTFTGTTLDPLMHGTLQIIKGEYTFNNESFVSTQGSVHLAGSSGSKSSLYVIGERQIDNIKIQAILKGDIADPTLTFRSNPPMSQKEILAWILFEHGIDEITPFQVAKLSQSVLNLSGGPENPDILTRLRNKMGLDLIDISGTDTGGLNELSLRLGKYISQGIYVSLNKSINAEANQVAIEANLSRHFKVQAEIGDNAEGKMSLKWARDY